MSDNLAAQGLSRNDYEDALRELSEARRASDNFWNSLSAGEKAQLAADLAGILDPTPISDGVGLVIAAARLDGWGVLGSAVSLIPYVGDALGKGVIKGAKYAKMLENAHGLYKRMEAAKARVAKLLEAQKRAFEAEIAMRKQAEAARAAAAKARVPCDKPECLPGKQIKQRLPDADKGTWKNADGTDATPGNGLWHPNANTPEGQAILEATGGKPIRWVDGHPQLDEFASHRLNMPVTGKHDFDVWSANEAMRLQNPNWVQPTNTTWHHSSTGQMVLLDSRMHGAIPHTGTASLARGGGY